MSHVRSKVARMRCNLIGVDPGVHTGLVGISVTTLNQRYDSSKVLRGTIKYPEDHRNIVGCIEGHEGTIKWLRSRFPFRDARWIFFCELFRLFPGAQSSKPEALSALWVQAQLEIRLYEEFGDDLRMVYGTAGYTKGSITDQDLKDMEMWWPGVLQRHERDAARCLELLWRKVAL